MILQNRSFTYVFFWHFLLFMWLPWPVLYSEEPADGAPRRYADVRQFLIEYLQPIREGAAVAVEIEGRDTESGADVTISGSVVDTEYVSDAAAALDSELLELAGSATIVVDDGDERHTVGGWGARFEDVEAKRITVTGLETTGDVMVSE
jgi:hypothetical protein